MKAVGRWRWYLLLLGGGLLAMADTMADLAAPWLALDIGGPALAGLSAAAALLPAIPASLLGGWAADRIDARWLLVGGAAALSAAVLLLAIAQAGGWLSPAILVLVVVLGASLDEPAAAALEARLPDLAEPMGMALHRLNTLDDLLKSAAFLVGPSLLALLTGQVGFSWALGAVAVIAMVSALSFASASPLPAANERLKPTSPWLGLQLVWSDRVLRRLALGGAGALTLFIGLEAILMPTLISANGGSSGELIWFLAPAGAAAVISSILYATGRARCPAEWLLAIGLGLGGTVVAALGALSLLGAPASARPVLAVAGALIGAGFGPVSPAVTTALQMRAEAGRRGLVMGATTALALSATPLGALLAGMLATLLPIGTLLLASGTAAMVLALWIIPCKPPLAGPKAASPHIS